ncbi:kinase binding protein CGI-121-domain-containing protein [Thamnocephalis sphaerospora]|uniref:EKC/KEOPS complex subunit CGI121 n=1 Tax=Thamnocephalis sphaerospora TaxID=78915 RepID=A0A4P9XVQ7_9FUNG|nr:kinase binding protein CGI-121-domain-containing protein [Thamnocephalis sphaerospora]|eukprot:RKP10367.1 kinase binding protein CGI-121-domain-containing protein [Thamnocephalis sphaerospora]
MTGSTHLLETSAETAHLFYFSNVRNAKALREQLLAGDARLAYALVDGRAVLDPFQLLVAAGRAAEAARDDRLKTRNVHSEVVYNLAPDTNIGGAFRNFGVVDDSQALAVVKIGGQRDEAESDLIDLIDGTPESTERIGSDVDLERIRKCYKLTPAEMAHRTQLINTVVTAMALKGVTQAAITTTSDA